MINSNVIYCSFTLEADIKFLMAKKQFMYLMKLKKFFCLRKTLKTRTTRCPRKNVSILLLRNIKTDIKHSNFDPLYLDDNNTKN